MSLTILLLLLALATPEKLYSIRVNGVERGYITKSCTAWLDPTLPAADAAEMKERLEVEMRHRCHVIPRGYVARP
jgi:hypothetical protein